MSLHHNPNGKYTKEIGLEILKEGPCGSYIGCYQNDTQIVVSSFFDDKLTQDEIIDLAQEASENLISFPWETNSGCIRLIGQTKNGLTIVIILNKDQELEELYPLIQQ